MIQRHGVTLKTSIGLGDTVQFSSLPENYYRHHGMKLVDVSKSWVFDYNPFVERGKTVQSSVELWNNHKYFTRPQSFTSKDANAPSVFLSNAEHHAAILSVPVSLNRPRLYRFEEYPFSERNMILIHVNGVSHGRMPDHIIEHVIKKYGKQNLYHIGKPTDQDIGIQRIVTPTVWELAEVISRSRMLIGMDSGPSWVAACYPDVIVKKVKTRHSISTLRTWVPLEMSNIHAHWDDRIFQIFNVSEDDVGFTQSYKRI